jgi:ferrous iron transport protein A
MSKKRLSEIEIGKKAIIISFDNDEIILKLMEMGCLPGEIISIEKKAPWGDPISILVSGYQLSLRMNEAEKIIVEEVIE